MKLNIEELISERDQLFVENKQLINEINREKSFYNTQLRLLEQERDAINGMCEKLGNALEKSIAMIEQTHLAARAFIISSASNDVTALLYWDKKRPKAQEMEKIRQISNEWNILKEVK